MFWYTFPVPGQVEGLWRERLTRLKEAGTIHFSEMPTPWQITQCSLRLWAFTTLVQPEDLAQQGGAWLSQFPQRGVVQFFSGTYFMDPTGLSRSLDGLIWHVLSLNHFNREALVFDLQMLTGFEGGLQALRSELTAVISGAHPQAAFLKNLTGDPHWHQVVLEEVEKAQRGEFLPTDPEDNLQGMVDLFLSYPRTPGETFGDPKLVARLLEDMRKTGKHLLKALAGQGELHEPFAQKSLQTEARGK